MNKMGKRASTPEQDAAALAYECAWCGAEIGQSCHVGLRGKEVPPHSTRLVQAYWDRRAEH